MVAHVVGMCLTDRKIHKKDYNWVQNTKKLKDLWLRMLYDGGAIDYLPWDSVMDGWWDVLKSKFSTASISVCLFS